MRRNETTPSLSAVLAGMQLPGAWPHDAGSPRKIFIGFFTQSSFDSMRGQLGWDKKPDGSYERVKSGYTQKISSTQASQLAVTSAQESAARQAFATWAQYAKVSFTSNQSDADIKIWIGNRSLGTDVSVATGQADRTDLADELHHMGAQISEIFFNTSDALVSVHGVTYAQFSKGPASDAAELWKRDSFGTIVHEIGHSLDLDHPSAALLGDGTRSVMSTNPNPIDPSHVPIAPMLYDVAKAQQLYGANLGAFAGTSVHGFASDRREFKVIWDALGNDTIDTSNFSNNSYISLDPGTFSAIGPGDVAPCVRIVVAPIESINRGR